MFNADSVSSNISHKCIKTYNLATYAKFHFIAVEIYSAMQMLQYPQRPRENKRLKNSLTFQEKTPTKCQYQIFLHSIGNYMMAVASCQYGGIDLENVFACMGLTKVV